MKHNCLEDVKNLKNKRKRYCAKFEPNGTER